jgi:small subunit ribosomal protein S1
VVLGRARRVTEFGVFVELLPGVDGLLHISEIPRHRQTAMREAAAAGAEVAVMIVSVDTAKRRVALALAPQDAVVGAQMQSAVTVGAVLVGTVERVEPFGVFVRLGPGQTGLVPAAELGTTRGADHRKMFAPGSEMKVLVLAIEEGGRRIRLSREQALKAEEQAETQAYIKDAGKKGGFGMTLGDFLKER